MRALRIIAGIIAGVLMLDAIAFCAWVASGQHPVDDMYAGTITAHILRALIN